ncbi:MAG: hypothetical protein Kow0042_10230 [Calditrichia bacterium]
MFGTVLLRKLLIKALFYNFLSYVILAMLYYGYLRIGIPDVTFLKNNNPRQTAFMIYKTAEAKSRGINYKPESSWIPLRNIPELLQKCLIVSEDAAFWIHNGIDWDEMWESLKRNYTEGEFFRGGSTITQQVAKNLFLSPRKTVSRKIKEVFIARELEKHLSKKRILELYFNSVEWGDQIFGVQTAAWHYFQKNPADLTLDEMARLVAVLPNPLKLNPVGNHPALRWRSQLILRRLRHYKMISEEQYMTSTEKLENLWES